MYSALVYIQSDREGSIQYVIANGKTEKGMLKSGCRSSMTLRREGLDCKGLVI